MLRQGQGPCRATPRVFRIVDNDGSHRGNAAAGRPQGRYPNSILVHRGRCRAGARGRSYATSPTAASTPASGSAQVRRGSSPP